MSQTDKNSVESESEEHQFSEKNDSDTEKSTGHWTNEEQTKYIVFIDLFKKEVKSKLKRRNLKIFKNMSQFIETRNAVQCRCHHTKLMRTFGSVEKIIKNYKNEFGSAAYWAAKKRIASNHNFNNSIFLNFNNPSNKISKTGNPMLKDKTVQTESNFCGGPNSIFLCLAENKNLFYDQQQSTPLTYQSVNEPQVLCYPYFFFY